jgi:hypothetical protein
MRLAAYQISFYAAVLIASGAADLAAAVGIWRRRGSPGRNSLCVAMLATAVWSFAYALEVSATSTGHREFWGALKYLGVIVLPAAWVVFALQYTGRMGRPRRWFLAALAVEPIAVLALLAISGTRHLIRFYPAGTSTASGGVLYWPHVVYSNALVLTGSVVLLVTVMRVSRLYWRQSLTLLVAICLPLIGNAMADFNAPPFQHLDPSPLATSIAAWVLVLGSSIYARSPAPTSSRRCATPYSSSTRTGTWSTSILRRFSFWDSMRGNWSAGRLAHFCPKSPPQWDFPTRGCTTCKSLPPIANATWSCR